MAKKLTSVEQTWRQPVLHDLFEAGGLFKHSIRTYGMNNISRRSLESHAQTICEEIKFRNFDFVKVDDALKRISNYVVFSPLHDSMRNKRLTENQLANIIASFCAEQEILWDDINTHRTTVEMEVYRKSILGKACWDFKCFLSQQADKKAPRAAASRTIDPATGKVIPKSGYKSSGPKSGIIKGLVGEPGDKAVFPSSDNLYVIVCGSTKTKKQYVFVDPIANKADPNIIKFGDPSGYSACKLFFNSIPAVQNAINKIETGDFKIPVDISGFTPAKQKADPNGYFEIATEIGLAFIKASKLNEAIEEDLEEQPEKRCSKFPEIDDIDVYNEAMHRYE